MRLKKSIAAMFLGMALISVAGCSTTSQSGVNTQISSTAEVKIKPLDEATAKKPRELLDPSRDVKERLRVWLPEGSPTTIFMATSLLDCDYKVKDGLIAGGKINNIQVANIAQEDNIAIVDVSYGVEGRQFSDRDFFAWYNGEWHLNALGLKDVYHINLSGYDDALLSMDANLGYGYGGSPAIVLDVKSKTGRGYSAGRWMLGLEAILITDTGEFPTSDFNNMYAPTSTTDIKSARASRFYFPFAGATGTPKALRLIGFNKLDDRGLPVNHDESQTITLNIDKMDQICSLETMK